MITQTIKRKWWILPFPFLIWTQKQDQLSEASSSFHHAGKWDTRVGQSRKERGWLLREWMLKRWKKVLTYRWLFLSHLLDSYLYQHNDEPRMVRDSYWQWEVGLLINKGLFIRMYPRCPHKVRGYLGLSIGCCNWWHLIFSIIAYVHPFHGKIWASHEEQTRKACFRHRKYVEQLDSKHKEAEKRKYFPLSRLYHDFREHHFPSLSPAPLSACFSLSYHPLSHQSPVALSLTFSLSSIPFLQDFWLRIFAFPFKMN